MRVVSVVVMVAGLIAWALAIVSTHNTGSIGVNEAIFAYGGAALVCVGFQTGEWL